MFCIGFAIPVCFKTRKGISFLARPVVDVPTPQPTSGLSETLSDQKAVVPAAMLRGHRLAVVPAAVLQGHSGVLTAMPKGPKL